MPGRPPGADDAPKSRVSRAVAYVNSDAMDIFFGSAIVLNSIVLGVDIEVGLRRHGGDSGPVLFWLQFGFMVLFVFELIWRVAADWTDFLCTLWCAFDFVIILTSVFDYIVTFASNAESPIGAVSVMRIVRFLRVVRLARILRIFPELALLFAGLAASVRAVFWIFLFLLVTVYICALACALELGRSGDEELQVYFGSVGSSFYTHFMVLTMENYPDVVKAAARQSRFWYFYFVAFIVFSALVLMNVVTGIVCESVVSTARNKELEGHVYTEESRKFQDVLTEYFISEGYDLNADISLEQFRTIMQNSGVREALNTLEICLEIEDATLFAILDEDGSGSLSLEEVFRSLLRLRGSKDAMHSLLVQGDLIEGGRGILQQLEETDADLTRGSRNLCDTLSRRFSARIAEVGTTSSAAGEGHGAADADRRQSRGARGRGRDRRSKHVRLDAAAAPLPAPSGIGVGASAGGRERRLRPEALHSAPVPAGLEATDAATLDQVDCRSSEWVSSPAAEELAVHPTLPAELADGALLAPSKGPLVGPDVDEAEDEAPAQRRVSELIKLAEGSGREARATLARLCGELEASRQRIRTLEATLRQPAEVAVQTDPEAPAPTVQLLAGGSPRQQPSEEEAGAALDNVGASADEEPATPPAPPQPPAPSSPAPSLPSSPAEEAAGVPLRQKEPMELRRRLEARLTGAATLAADRRRTSPSVAAAAASPRLASSPGALSSTRRRMLGAAASSPRERRGQARTCLLAGDMSDEEQGR